MTPFPWAAAMGFGFGVLRLSSHAFWRLTPRELAAAWRGLAGEQVRPPGRDQLEMMMQRFPDGR
jgi:uncharacterized phage protein (TIGR02216 family)